MLKLKKPDGTVYVDADRYERRSGQLNFFKEVSSSAGVVESKLVLTVEETEGTTVEDMGY